jgi:hypothetical protein
MDKSWNGRWYRVDVWQFGKVQIPFKDNENDYCEKISRIGIHLEIGVVKSGKQTDFRRDRKKCIQYMLNIHGTRDCYVVL